MRQGARLRFAGASRSSYDAGIQTSFYCAFFGEFAVVILYPRWPIHDEDSCSPLPGLTADEAREFQQLDAEPPIDKNGLPLLEWETNDEMLPPSQWRWLELYRKYRAACLAVRRGD